MKATPPSLRERNKADKLGRIREAALALFQTQGFDATTTREVAERAEVGIGTVFMYAADKRDLLFLIFNDPLDRLVESAFADVATDLPLSAQMHQVFSHFYAMFAERMDLARVLLRELVFFSEGRQAAQFIENRRRIMEGLKRLVEAAGAAGRLPADADAQRIANAFFFLYSGEVRLWLSQPAPSLDSGLDSLRHTFGLFGQGLGEGRPPPAGKPGVPKN